MADLSQTTTIKIRGKLSRLSKRLKAAERAFEIAWKRHSQTHSREDHKAMMETYNTAKKLLDEYNAEYNRLEVRRFEKVRV